MPTCTQSVFDADLARMNAALTERNSVRTEPDGFQWVDESRLPAALASAYRRLIQYGYANDLL